MRQSRISRITKTPLSVWKISLRTWEPLIKQVFSESDSEDIEMEEIKSNFIMSPLKDEKALSLKKSTINSAGLDSLFSMSA